MLWVVLVLGAGVCRQPWTGLWRCGLLMCCQLPAATPTFGVTLSMGPGLGLGLGLGCLVCRPHPPLAQPVCQCAQSLACVRWLASQAMSKKERMY